MSSESGQRLPMEELKRRNAPQNMIPQNCPSKEEWQELLHRLDELEQHALKLLHAKTGAAVARDIFGVKDAVCEAIRWHTTGKPDMTLLEMVIYLADYIEPNRDFPGVDELRRAVYDDLDKGLLMGLSDTIDEMERMGNPVHHDTLEARDFLLRGEAK